LHGRGYWLRPLLIEILLPLCFVGMARYYLSGQLLPDFIRDVPLRLSELRTWLCVLFAFHAGLLVLLVVVTFIDFDDQTIPDAITVPGTLVVLLLSALTLKVRLPELSGEAPGEIAPVLLSSPAGWNPLRDGFSGLLLGLAIFLGWCFALSDRRWIGRHGWRRAIDYFFAGFVRNSNWRLLIPIALAGSLGIAVTWFIDGDAWRGLLSSLVGLAGGGATVWAVRLMAAATLRKEAMGFGDVTLMAMIGAALGWQAALLGFFLAPLTALAIVVVQALVSGERAIAFGPYLCAGSALTVAAWDPIWNGYASMLFGLGPVLPLILLVALCLMGILLWMWRIVESRIGGY
jgi:prepilin signal peptidase PulO-like enzyme (type II secretory pathway)